MGAASGRIDAVAFMVGLVAGVWAFAGLSVGLAGFVASGELGGVTLADLVGMPFWVLALAVVGLALATFWLVGRVERRQGGSTSCDGS